MPTHTHRHTDTHTHSLTHSLIHSYKHTHPLTHKPTHTLTHTHTHTQSEVTRLKARLTTQEKVLGEALIQVTNTHTHNTYRTLTPPKKNSAPTSCMIFCIHTHIHTHIPKRRKRKMCSHGGKGGIVQWVYILDPVLVAYVCVLLRKHGNEAVALAEEVA